MNPSIFTSYLKRPLPVTEFRFIDAMLVGIIAVLDNLILQPLLDMGSGNPKLGNPVDDIDRQIKAIDLIPDGQLKGGIDIAFFLVTAHVQVFMVGAAISEFVNQPGVAVEIENDRSVGGKQTVKIPVGEAVKVFRLRFHFKKINDINETDFKTGEVLPQKSGRCQGFRSGDVAGAGHHHVGFTPLIVTGPIPDADALGAVLNGFFHAQVLKMRLLIGNDDIYIV